MDEIDEKVATGKPLRRKPGRPRGIKSKVKQAARNAIANAKSDEEKRLVRNMFRLSKGDGGTAFNATKFLLVCRHDWKATVADQPPKAKPEKLGKKEQANLDAQDAHESTPWQDLLH